MRQSEVGGLPPHSLPPPHLGASKPQFPLLDNAGGQRPAIEAQNAVEGLASGGTRPQRGTALARTIETHGVRAGPRARWARPRRRCPRLPLRASQACVPPCLPLRLSPSGRPPPAGDTSGCGSCRKGPGPAGWGLLGSCPHGRANRARVFLLSHKGHEREGVQPGARLLKEGQGVLSRRGQRRAPLGTDLGSEPAPPDSRVALSVPEPPAPPPFPGSRDETPGGAECHPRCRLPGLLLHRAGDRQAPQGPARRHGAFAEK